VHSKTAGQPALSAAQDRKLKKNNEKAWQGNAIRNPKLQIS